jgi:hypothetical protein
MDIKLKEEEFGPQLASILKIPHEAGQLSCRKSLLYALSIDSDGNVRMGIDSDSGEPIRGKGKGFEQDLLIWEAREHSHTSIIPRVSIELKLNRVTTHDAIIYSEKARRLRSVYPYARFGLILGNLSQIPGRVLRLSQQFDFISTLQVPFVEEEIKEIETLLISEVALSRQLSDLLEKGTRIKYLRRELVLA